MSNNTGKIIIANIILAALAVASIITLWVGSFMKIELNIKLNSESLNKLMGNAEEGTTPSGSGGTGVSEADMQKILNTIDIEVPFVIDLKSASMIKAVGGDSDNKILKEVIGTQIDNIVDILMDKVDEIFTSVVTVMVDAVVEEVEKEIMQQIEAELEKQDVSKEEVAARLEEEYGITQNDIDELKQDVSDSATALLNGEPENVSDILENSETFDKLVALYAEQAIKEEKGEEYVPTEEEIAGKRDSLKTEIITEYEKTVDEMKNENGEFSKESVIVGLVNESGLQDENGNAVQVNDIEEVKSVIANKINSVIAKGETSDTISKVFAAMGIFILIVMAAWAYLIVKIVVKLFMRNKTVRVGVPQAFGWMPHVFFVGLPMTLIKVADKALVAGAENMAELQQVQEILSMITLKFSSLTWVSALCSVLLLVVWIPYRRWRKEAKMKR